MQNSTPQRRDVADTATSEQKRVSSQQTTSFTRNARDKWGCDGDIEEDIVVVGGCVNATVAGASERGGSINGSRYENNDGHGHNESNVRHAKANGTLPTSSYAATYTADDESVKHAQTPVLASTLTPPLLKEYAICDDSRPVTKPEDYDQVAREAYSHWRSRLKQPTEALEQSVTDVRDFMLGSSRRRLLLVLIQLYGLIEKTPRIYELLEYKQNLESSNSTQVWLERKLNSIWAELKIRCSLLILDKESRAWSTIDQAAIPDVDVCEDKAAFVQSLVLSIIKTVIENCSVLWDSFDDSVRGLVLVNSGEEILHSIFLAADGSHDLYKGVLRSLLNSFSVLPDLYKAVIRGTVDTAVATSTNNFRLVASELQRCRVLPGVLFRAIATYARTTLNVDEIIQQLDGLFGTSGSSLWIGTPANRTRSKYSQSGIELYELICSNFFAQSTSDEKQRRAPQFMRVISGLVGFLRLDAKESFLDTFKRTECFALDSSTADVSASLFLVLVGFGNQITAQGILNAVSEVDNPLVAARIDSLIAHLLTDHVKPVAEFVNSSLGMDFVYPRERLFYFKDIVAQSKSAYFYGATIARRLISRDYYKQHDSTICCSHLQNAAILYFLQAEVFQENGIDIREWFSALIWNMDAAVADNFGAVVKAYVSAIFSSSAITPIPEISLWKSFSPENVFSIASVDSVSPAQVLCLLYLLYYCENLAEQSKGPGSQFPTLGNRPLISYPLASGNQPRASPLGAPLGTSIIRSTSFSSQSPYTASTGGSSPPITMFGIVRRGEYSDQLLDSLPISWILRCVSRSSAYRLVWPELLSMATAQFPDQLDVVSVLQHELYADTVQRTPYKPFASEPRIFRNNPLQSLPGGMFSKLTDEAHRLIKHAVVDLPKVCASGSVPLSPLLSTIEQYFKYPVAVRMETCGAFSGYICRVALQNCADDEIVASICQAWFSLHELNPHIVSTATANAWRTEAESTKPKLIPQDVWLDPLVLFRSDSRVFESPGLTDILLTVLSEFLVLSRTSMRRIHSLRQKDSCTLKPPHIVALVQLQESSALQILIELASLSRNDAVRSLIYAFIHARFLEQRVVQKLVHFQAYELSAIDDMVKHVPSMHSCSEFIPEMLMQSLPRLQLFSVRLAASITSNYPIVANEGMTKEVILPHIQTTLMQMAGTVAEEQLAISNAMLEAVIRINSVFTLIRQDCIRLVNAVRNAAIEKAQPALQDNQQPQQCDFIQSIAKWVGSCDKVLEIIGDVNLDTGRPQYTQIEDVNADEFVSAVELSAKSRENSKHIGHKPPPSASNTADTGTQQSGMATPMSPSLVGLPTHPVGQTLPPPFSPNLSQPHGSGPTPGNAKRAHTTAMSSSVDFGRGRGGFGNPGASRGSSSATGPLPNLTEQGSASAPSAQMVAGPGPGPSIPVASAGFKKRTRSRSRPPKGKEINGSKPAAIGLKRAKVPGGDRQQRGKDH